ncbi:MAG TPA: acetyl ornithine aminotransferase family protein [Candidatus Thermoplasmatota archaeon]|nr:acetyl ornithine aminotransferase family protein [Candidatus Thermoplasmatota archaeon]
MPRPFVPATPPGKKGKEIVERDHKALVKTTKTSPVVVERGEGCWLTGVDGERYLDFTSGVGVVNTGHSHPAVVEAIRRQAGQLVHFAGTDYYYEQQVELAEKLARIAPGAFAKKVFFTNSGTESNEAAIKMARYATRRRQFLAFIGGFHGRTLGSLSLTASKPVHQDRFFPAMPGVHHAPYANPYRNPWNLDGYEKPAELTKAALEFIEKHLLATYVPASDVAAIFVEPVQGEGGYVVPPKDFHAELRKLADRHGMLLCFDEVQTGFGRTGKMFAAEHFGVSPDTMQLAKAMASGLPMGALVARADLDFDVEGAHSNTYGGNVLACAASLATIDVLQKGLVENAAKRGAHLRARLDELPDEFPIVGDVRGLGLMQATDLVKDRRTKEHATKERDAVIEAAYKKGLVLLPCGKSGIRYIPPLVVTDEEIDVAVEIVRECLRAAR